MKIVGGPRDGQEISIAESKGGPELRVPGMVLEYAFTSPGVAQIRMTMDAEQKPSIPGLVERYVCRDEAWHYIPPSSPTGYMISPPVPVA